MAKSAELLGSAIYEIQEVWKGPDKPQQANYALRSLPSCGTPIRVPRGHGIGGYT